MVQILSFPQPQMETRLKFSSRHTQDTLEANLSQGGASRATSNGRTMKILENKDHELVT
jgi:hypothetical protein